MLNGYISRTPIEETYSHVQKFVHNLIRKTKSFLVLLTPPPTPKCQMAICPVIGAWI